LLAHTTHEDVLVHVRNGEEFPLRWDGRGSTRNDEMRYRKNDKKIRCRNVTVTHEDAMNPFFDVDAWAEKTRVVLEHLYIYYIFIYIIRVGR